MKRCTRATICIDDIGKHDLVRRVAVACGLTIVDSADSWDILWCDYDTNPRLKRFQRTNQFPFIAELCHKKRLAKNLQQMKKHFPDEYSFFPETWILPWDTVEVTKYLRQHKATLIVKPDTGSNGNGISLVKNLRALPVQNMKNCICQVYIANPFLVDGFKFDIRIYTLLTSCDPLRIYTHADGLVRFATVKYETPCTRNLSNIRMHLTNYALNKSALSFIQDDEVGSKRKLCTLNAWFRRNGYDTIQIWERIDDVIVKTILAAAPSLKEKYNTSYARHNYRSACFQLLGFDILLDEQLRPYVIEVNHSPSFHTDTELDLEVKEQVLRDTFLLCNLGESIRDKIQREEKIEAQRRLTKRTGEMMESRIWSEVKKSKQWAWEREHSGRYRLLYPCINEDKYRDMCLVIDTASYYKDTVASNIRTTLGKATRYDLIMKQSDRGKIAATALQTANSKLQPKVPTKLQPKVPTKLQAKGSTKLQPKGPTKLQVAGPAKLQATVPTKPQGIVRGPKMQSGTKLQTTLSKGTSTQSTVSKLRAALSKPTATPQQLQVRSKLQSKNHLDAIYGAKKKNKEKPTPKCNTDHNTIKPHVELTNNLSRTVEKKNGNNGTSHPARMSKLRKPFVSKVGQPFGNSTLNQCLNVKKSVVPTVVTRSMRLKQIAEDRREEKERLAELKARYDSIGLLGLEKVIYFTFKESDNLSSGDVKKYKYLEKTSVNG
ncbi:hypothetical protein WDU94_010558 [Cyamophila willieti]